MGSKTIVLWGQGDLLSSSVERLLREQKGWKVINIPNNNSLDTLTKAVDLFNPDVVIIHQGYCSGELNLPTALFHKRPGVKVIILGPRNNMMEVYSKQNIIVKSSSDLISVVTADPVRPTDQ